NFGTRDEKVYNWCMKHCLGCTHTTDDGLRYNFHQATVGTVYIPPVGWTPPGKDSGLSADDEAMRKAVLQVLGSSSLQSIRFQNPTLNHTTTSMIMRVASLIARNKVRIAVDTDAIANEYDPDGNVITLTDADTGNVVTRSTVVHEAVHAAQDAAGRPMLAVQTECDAYIAQMIYIANQGYASPPPVPKPVLSGADMYDEVKKKDFEKKKRVARAEERIYKIAWEMGQKVIRTVNAPPGVNAAGPGRYARSEVWDNLAVVSAEDNDQLKAVILTHPLYRGGDQEFAKINGV
ncbi:MAG: hypothetical protein ACRC33_17185, partial [Gemmataceae bacterium]